MDDRDKTTHPAAAEDAEILGCKNAQAHLLAVIGQADALGLGERIKTGLVNALQAVMVRQATLTCDGLKK